MPSERATPIPPRVLWREFRVRALPALLFLAALSVVIYLWEAQDAVPARFVRSPAQNQDASTWAAKHPEVLVPNRAPASPLGGGRYLSGTQPGRPVR